MYDIPAYGALAQLGERRLCKPACPSPSQPQITQTATSSRAFTGASERRHGASRVRDRGDCAMGVRQTLGTSAVLSEREDESAEQSGSERKTGSLFGGGSGGSRPTGASASRSPSIAREFSQFGP